MSNHSHLHKDAAGNDVDAFGTREACNVCRKAAGKPPIEEVQERLAERGVVTTQGGNAPDEQLLADLEEQERENDELRVKLRVTEARVAELEGLLAKAQQGGQGNAKKP